MPGGSQSGIAWERLILQSLIPGQICECEELASRWGVTLHEAAISAEFLDTTTFYRAVAYYFDATFVEDEDEGKFAQSGLLVTDKSTCSSVLHAEVVRLSDNSLLFGTKGQRLLVLLETLADLRQSSSVIYLAAPAAYQRIIYHSAREAITRRATNSLKQAAPQYSASQLHLGHLRRRVAPSFGLLLVLIILVPSYFWLQCLSVVFFLVLMLRMIAPIYDPDRISGERELAEKELCDFTLLVPLYQESAVVPQLVQALKSLDYPKAKLEILLLIEESDHETQSAIQAVDLPYYVRPIVVADIGPRTKPKALNVGLELARGEIIGIYDAEDIPEAHQLNQIANIFAHHPREIVCVQAQLAIYNGGKSWLSGLFAAEYHLLFAHLLPLLHRLKIPIPLGGTSNFFRTSVLRQVGGWDPYNVTEDADLGLRLAQFGFSTTVSFSQTFEEAPTRILEWIPQRTRWFKGWMITMLVHTKNIKNLKQQVGLLPTIGVTVFVLGLVASALIHPWVLLATLISSLFNLGTIQGQITDFHLILGPLILAYFASAVSLGYVSQSLHHPIRPLSLLAIPYLWLLISYAAYRALWQLIWNPYQWEKTPHYGYNMHETDWGKTALTRLNRARRLFAEP